MAMKPGEVELRLVERVSFLSVEFSILSMVNTINVVSNR